MNQQILEYLLSKDRDTNILGIELVANLKSGISRYLNWTSYMFSLGKISYWVYYDLWETVQEKGEWSIMRTKKLNKIIIRRIKNNGSNKTE